MLRNAAGFAGSDFRRADRVEQRRFAVIDMAHDGDNGRARFDLRRIVRYIEKTLFHVGFRHPTHAVAHFLGNQLRGIGIDHIVDGCHLALLHEQADDVDRALGHAVGEILNGDRFWEL